MSERCARAWRPVSVERWARQWGGSPAQAKPQASNGADASRNTRLAAIRSFFKYVAINEPELLHHCQQVLALPLKRHEKRMIDYLDREQMEALLAAPDLSSWYGRPRPVPRQGAEGSFDTA